jgi:hypothetical protein
MATEQDVFEEKLFMDTHTLDEVRARLKAQPYQDNFSDEIKFIGEIIGSLIINDSMIEINKMIIEVQLERYKIQQPASFTTEAAAKITIGFVVGAMCGIDNRALNDLVAFTLKFYFSKLEEYVPSKLLN